ncbi:uncharacterized protein TNCV_1611591 [Trichonephila clavipes]|nr:uncharacterized protein TNCV_1611591 [Trichonephila clavipes]
MPNSPSQMIPDMLDQKQIWGSGRPRKGSNNAETVLIEAFTTESPNANTIVITAEIESGFSSLKTTWFHFAAVQFPRARHHSKRRRQWVGVKGSSRNGRRDPKCPLARCLRMVREDTGAPGEGATCAWMANDEAVGCTHAFLWMWRLLDDWSVEGVLSLIVRVQYFVRGGFAGNRSRASSKHLSPHLPVGELDSSGGQTGVALHLKLHVWASGLQRNRPDVDVFEK